MKKMTFFCSPIGLGHVTRDSAIVQYIPEISTKFVTGNAAAKFLEQLQFDVKDEYIPPQFIVENGLLQNPLRWLWKYYKYYQDCKNISSKIIKNENPQVVVSDEDFASITIAQEQNIPTVLITDVLETRFTSGFGSFIEKKMNHSMRDIMKKCDVVILPEKGDDKDNIRRVGPIVRKINNSREELRKRFSFNKKTIVVSIGGTDAGKFLIENTLNVIIPDDSELVIVSGPTLKKDYGKNVRSLGFVNNLHEIIFASDLIISLAGKSTIDESKSYGTPGIFIPIKNHFEQEDNAKEEGFSYNDINRLDSLISQKLEEKRNPQNYDGAKKAAEIIKNIFPK
jgi:UDP-N-acetylglucosamine--N-acetylmuramyl-(pentapeptide) pyrophosphoryl-undecaprenol N-acetylglucosamine transferase